MPFLAGTAVFKVLWAFGAWEEREGTTPLEADPKTLDLKIYML